MKGFTYIPLYFLLTYSYAQSVPCYFPDGAIVQDTPCNSTSSSVSACCGPGFACLSNGLCALTEHTPKELARNSPSFIRGSCTDKTWSSSECPQYCKNTANGDNLGLGGNGVNKCDYGSKTNRYYCSDPATEKLSEADLCSNFSYYFESPEFPSTMTIIGYEATPSSSPTRSLTTSQSSPPFIPASSSSTSASTSTFPASLSPSSSTQMINLGLGLGLGLGIPLVLASIFIIYRRLHSKAQARRSSKFSALTVKDVETSSHSPSSGTPSLKNVASIELTEDTAIHMIQSKQVYELSTPKEEVFRSELHSPHDGPGLGTWR